MLDGRDQGDKVAFVRGHNSRICLSVLLLGYALFVVFSPAWLIPDFAHSSHLSVSSIFLVLWGSYGLLGVYFLLANGLGSMLQRLFLPLSIFCLIMGQLVWYWPIGGWIYLLLGQMLLGVGMALALSYVVTITSGIINAASNAWLYIPALAFGMAILFSWFATLFVANWGWLIGMRSTLIFGLLLVLVVPFIPKLQSQPVASKSWWRVVFGNRRLVFMVWLSVCFWIPIQALIGALNIQVLANLWHHSLQEIMLVIAVFVFGWLGSSILLTKLRLNESIMSYVLTIQATMMTIVSLIYVCFSHESLVGILILFLLIGLSSSGLALVCLMSREELADKGYKYSVTMLLGSFACAASFVFILGYLALVIMSAVSFLGVSNALRSIHQMLVVAPIAGGVAVVLAFYLSANGLVRIQDYSH